MVETKKNQMVNTYNATEDEFPYNLSWIPSTIILPYNVNNFQRNFWYKMLSKNIKEFKFKIGDEWQ